MVVDQLLRWRTGNARFFISVISEIEILAFPRLTEEEESKIRRFLQEFTVISLDSQLAKLVAEIRRGSKLKLGDSIVVATALLTKSVLITQDKEILKKAKSIVRVHPVVSEK
jgi:predicted nucleic acid-binding protein